MSEGNLNTRSWFVAEVGKSHGRSDVDAGEEPEQDDGEESTDRKDDEGAPTVDDGAEEEKDTEKGENSK